MPFKINVKRAHSFTHTEGEDSFTVDFKFKTAEDRRSKALHSEIDDDTKEGRLALFWSLIREDLVDVHGLINEETNEEITLKNEDGTINEELQKTVFDFCLQYEDIRDRILTAQAGLLGKNSLTGATQS